MDTFWTWAVRNPFALAAVLCLLSGFTGVLEWGLALTGTALGGMIAQAAHRLAMHSRHRRARAHAAKNRVPVDVRPGRSRYYDFVDDRDDELYDVAA